MSLTNNKTALEALRDKANALPDAGSGGGLETCTVVLRGVDWDTAEGILTSYIATVVENGTVGSASVINSSFGGSGLYVDSGTVIENVLCGSSISVTAGSKMTDFSMASPDTEGYFGEEPPDGAEFIAVSSDGKTVHLKAPSVAGSIIQFQLCKS